MRDLPKTEQLNFLHDLKGQLRLSNEQLDRWSQDRFGRDRADMNRRETSQMIDQLIRWRAAPEQLLRWLGQVPLFEMEAVS